MAGAALRQKQVVTICLLKPFMQQCALVTDYQHADDIIRVILVTRSDLVPAVILYMHCHAKSALPVASQTKGSWRTQCGQCHGRFEKSCRTGNQTVEGFRRNAGMGKGWSSPERVPGGLLATCSLAATSSTEHCSQNCKFKYNSLSFDAIYFQV